MFRDGNWVEKREVRVDAAAEVGKKNLKFEINLKNFKIWNKFKKI